MTAPHADAELLMLEARLIEEEAKAKQSVVEKANKVAEATERQLIDTPAQGMVGLNVKLDHALKCMNPDPRGVPFDDLDWGPSILVRVYEDVARLAPKPDAEPPASVVDLESEMIRQREMTDNSDLPESTTAVSSERVLALIQEIAGAKANTPPDLAAQARTLEYVLVTWGSDWDGFEDFARVVREGAERTAGAS